MSVNQNRKNEYSYVLGWSKKLKAIKLLGNSCYKCGIDDPVILQFHHLGDKEVNINILLRSKWSSILSEINKCLLLCANCHHLVHFPENNDIKNKLLDIKGTSRCKECLYTNSLTFHHSRGIKKFNIGDVTSRRIRPAIDELVNELEKCDVICHNCHIKKHFDYNKFNNLMPIILRKINKHTENVVINSDEILSLAKKGIGCTTISKILGYGRTTVRYYLQKFHDDGLIDRIESNNKPYSIESMFSLISIGYGHRKLVKKTGCGRATAKKYIKMYKNKINGGN